MKKYLVTYNRLKLFGEKELHKVIIAHRFDSAIKLFDEKKRKHDYMTSIWLEINYTEEK